MLLIRWHLAVLFCDGATAAAETALVLAAVDAPSDVAMIVLRLSELLLAASKATFPEVR